MIVYLYRGDRSRWAVSVEGSGENLPADGAWSYVAEVNTSRERIGLGMDERLAELGAKGFLITEITVTFE